MSESEAAPAPVQKSAEELKRQQERDAEERNKTIASRVPQLSIDGLDKDKLEKKVRELYDTVCRLEDEKYDWEFKLRKMDFELSELNIIVNDIKGHFVKPPLKKISKTEQKLAKIAEVKSKLSGAFGATLKSTGQSKYALDEKEEGGKKPEWGQDSLKRKEGEEDEEGAEGEEAEEEQEEEEEEEEEE